MLDQSGHISRVVLTQPFEPHDVGFNPARFTGFNRVITVGRLLTYNYLALQIHSSASKYDEWRLRAIITRNNNNNQLSSY